MSLNHPVPQSLPSFAQAFSAPSLNSISAGNNSLPPIQSQQPRRPVSPSVPSLSRPPSIENNINAINNVANHRKRTRTDVASAIHDDDLSDSGRQSPRLIRIKEEHDLEMLDHSSPPHHHLDPQDTSATPAPSSLRPNSLKKRRVTISGTPHPLNTDVRIPPSEQTSSTPISPVVIGFTIQRDDPAALEQVRSMLTVKQKQKALIEQRRGSTAGILSTAAGGGPANSIPDIAGKSPAASRTLRRSPNPVSSSANNNNNRRAPNTPAQTVNAPVHPPSPSPIIVPSQQPMQVPSQVPSGMGKNSLPAPPISFARRRAGQLGGIGKKKPADIVISPREAHTQEQFQPAIQSAPPIPQAGQGQFYTARFPMTLPRLPSIMAGGESVRRSIPGQVPPTPTRLSMQRPSANHPPSSMTNISRRSPPPSIAIATTLVPPTPASLHHPGYAGEKAAFLAPFGVFYDDLNDTKQLKNWLGEQLHKSNQLVQTLTQQQERFEEMVDSLVERKLVGMRDEIGGLHRRVEDLEDALRVTRAELVHRRQSDEVPVPGKLPVRNGAMQTVHETYTFPPVPPRRAGEAIRKKHSAEGRSDKEHSLPRSENSSPVPYNTRRLSISATRLDPPRLHPPDMQSPPQGTREASRLGLSPPSSNARAKSASSNSTPVLASRSHHPHPDAQALHRKLSSPRVAIPPPEAAAERPGSPMDADE